VFFERSGWSAQICGYELDGVGELELRIDVAFDTSSEHPLGALWSIPVDRASAIGAALGLGAVLAEEMVTR
jgi:hypothetical protein